MRLNTSLSIPQMWSQYKSSFQGLPREIWYLGIVMLINRTGSMVLPFLGIYVVSELGFDLSFAGVIMAFYGMGSIMGAGIGGVLTDRFGPIRVQLTSLILSGCMFFILMQMHDAWSFAIALMLTSACADAFRPANMTAIGHFASEDDRARAVGLNRLAVNLGYAAGPAMGGLIAHNIGFSWLFIVDGIFCFIAAMMLYQLFKHNRPGPVRSDDESTIETKPWKDRPYLMFLLLHMLCGVVFLQLIYTLPVYFEHDLGYSESTIGYLMAFNGLFIAAIELPMIHKIGNRIPVFYLLSLGIGLIGIAYFMLTISQIMIFSMLCIFFITVGEILNLPYGTTVVLNRSPAQGRGRYMSFYTMSWSLCTVLTPLIGLNVADHFGFSTLWYGCAVASVLLVVGFNRLSKVWD